MTWNGRTLYIQERVYNLALSAWLSLEGEGAAWFYGSTASMEDMEYENFHCMWSTLVEDIK